MKRSIFISLLVCCAPLIAPAQERSAAEIIREQAGNIADSAIVRLLGSGIREAELVIEGDGMKSITQNAFIDAATKREVSFVTNVVRTDVILPRLRVSILGQSVHAESIENGRKRRTVRCVLEPRLESVSLGIRTYGLSERQQVDTVAVAASLQLTDDAAGEGPFDRFMLPLIVGASIVLAVYLLFTVRS